jgi:hypothetical protein
MKNKKGAIPIIAVVLILIGILIYFGMFYTGSLISGSAITNEIKIEEWKGMSVKLQSAYFGAAISDADKNKGGAGTICGEGDRNNPIRISNNYVISEQMSLASSMSYHKDGSGSCGGNYIFSEFDADGELFISYSLGISLHRNSDTTSAAIQVYSGNKLIHSNSNSMNGGSSLSKANPTHESKKTDTFSYKTNGKEKIKIQIITGIGGYSTSSTAEAKISFVPSPEIPSIIHTSPNLPSTQPGQTSPTYVQPSPSIIQRINNWFDNLVNKFLGWFR